MRSNPVVPGHQIEPTLNHETKTAFTVSVSENQTAVNGDIKGVSSGSVECCFPVKYPTVAPTKNSDPTPGGGW
jgi:hypothetical protein